MNDTTAIPDADQWAALDATRRAAEATAAAAEKERAGRPTLTPADTTAASGNEMRPESWDEVIGQDHVKGILREMVVVAKARNRPLSHTLFRGPAGTGKTTLAHVIAHELGRHIYQLEAPVSADTLMELAEVMQDGDILFLDEIHQQALPDRRGRQSATTPEVLFSIMEDFTMPTPFGVVEFPRITIMGATTDEGTLPDAFIDRFKNKPMLEEYSIENMVEIAHLAAGKIGVRLTPVAARMFAEASRRVPREVTTFLTNADDLGATIVTPGLAFKVVHDMNGYTEDGLTPDMQALLVFLYTRAKRVSKGEVVYQASVNSIATAIGKSRDTKAIQLRVEPYLIREGYLQVLHGGRALTERGIERAHELADEKGKL
jgi:Holliday junction DNA helicase RuvB